MEIEKSHIHCCTTILISFNGEQKFTLGDTILPVYTGGVNQYITFVVLDSPSTYNGILKKPWIHAMRAVPFYLPSIHQVP